MKDYFEGSFVGQVPVRRRLSHYVNIYRESGIFQNSLFISQKGDGKTFLCNEVGRNLKKPFIELNSSSIKNRESLFEKCLVPMTEEHGRFTILFDEIHLLEKKIVNLLLTALAPNKDNKNTVRYNDEGGIYTFDFSKVTFLAATTESHKVFTALKDRLKQIHLSKYSIEELKEIMKFNSSEIDLDQDALNYLSKFIRENARSAADMGKEIVNFCLVEGKSQFKLKDAKELINILDVYEFGLSRLERQCLEYLVEGNKTLTALSARSGFTTQAQRDLENKLLNHGLIDIAGKRKITGEGLKYLRRNVLR